MVSTAPLAWSDSPPRSLSPSRSENSRLSSEPHGDHPMTRVYVSAVMPITLEQAWSVLRDFNGLPNYHPFFVKSYIEDGKPADKIGCIRHFHDHDGNAIREELLSL